MRHLTLICFHAKSNCEIDSNELFTWFSFSFMCIVNEDDVRILYAFVFGGVPLELFTTFVIVFSATIECVFLMLSGFERLFIVVFWFGPAKAYQIEALGA